MTTLTTSNCHASSKEPSKSASQKRSSRFFRLSLFSEVEKETKIATFLLTFYYLAYFMQKRLFAGQTHARRFRKKKKRVVSPRIAFTNP